MRGVLVVLQWLVVVDGSGRVRSVNPIPRGGIARGLVTGKQAPGNRGLVTGKQAPGNRGLVTGKQAPIINA
jgi:hypothetical protein